ncbi:MAG: type I restriction-modification system subunit M N-terminal domain-containing protein [Thermodesulfobacteriota bacterium]
MSNFGEKVSFLWSVADLIRDTFKRSKYQDVILSLTVIRRIDCVLAPTKDEVLKTYRKYKDKLDNLDDVLRKTPGFALMCLLASSEGDCPRCPTAFPEKSSRA